MSDTPRTDDEEVRSQYLWQKQAVLVHCSCELNALKSAIRSHKKAFNDKGWGAGEDFDEELWKLVESE